MGRGGREKDQDEPERKCIVSGESQPKAGLIRFCADPEGQVVPDILGRLPGRGLYVSADRALIDKAAKKGVTLVALSPGTVSTEAAEGELGYGQKMQAMPGSVTPTDSVTSMLKVIDGLTPAQNGQFLDYKDGRVIQF